MKDRGNEAAGPEALGEASLPRKPWSTPRVILSEVRSTLHQIGLTPKLKTTATPDNVTPGGSQGS
jgi:hypothetical protein